MNKIIKIIGGIVIIIIITVLVVVFSEQEKEKETINIGVILPLTGKVAKWGQWAKNGIDLAVEEINSLRNYPYHLNVVYEDNLSTSKDGISAFQKLVYSHNPSIIVGPITSQITLSVAPVAEENKVVLLSPGASADAIRYAGDYIFRLRETSMVHGHAMADYVDKLGTEKVGVLYVNAENGVGYAEAFKQRFEELGGIIDFYEAFNEEDTDFRTHLVKVKNKNIEVLYVPGLASEIGQILKQAKELDLGIQFLSSTGAENPKLIEIAGDAAEDLVYTYPAFDPDSSDLNVQKFVTKYSEKYGDKPEATGANSYDSIKILAEIFKKYGFESDQIKQGLYNTKDYEGVSGTLSFDEYGDVIKSVMLKTVKNGEFVPYEE